MSFARILLPRLEGAIREVCQVLEQEGHSTFLWEGMSEGDLWRELVACILGSRVSFDIARAAVERMDKANLFSEGRRSSGYDKYERDVISALWGTAEPPRNSSSQSRYPFPKLRAKQIRAAAEKLCAQSVTIRSLLESAGDVRETRRRLVSDLSGLGPKQASLFLRNIGYATHIAVLDIHVLTYMNWIGLIPAPLKSIRTMQQYETLESTFVEHASSVGYPPSSFDIAVWVVVRVVKKEYGAWQ